METAREPPQSYFSTKLIFILFGIASLLGWNALLTELGFFIHFLKRMNPAVSFSFLNYILNIIFQFLLFCKRNLFSLKFQLYAGIIGSIIFLILIPLCTMTLGEDTTINVLVTGGLVVLMGFVNAMCSGGFFNLVSNFPLEMIVALSTGQGFSGITMNILQYIVLATVENINVQAWIFFGVSVIILLICLILLHISFNSEYFQYYLDKTNNKSINERTSLLIGDTEPEEKLSIVEALPEQNYLGFWGLLSRIWLIDLLVLYTYIVTFALFPNASLKQNLFNMDGAYGSNTIILIYNVFDTIGRYLVSKITPTKKLNIIVILSRSILLFTLIFNYYCQKQLEWNIIQTSILLIINVGLLAATNGMGTTLCFGLAPNQVEDQYKGQAGTSVSFFLILGIALGSLVGFLTDIIMTKFE